MIDLHSLSLTRKRELKIKITFPEINNLNLVGSAGQLKFLTEMSCAWFSEISREREEMSSAGKPGYNAYNVEETSDARANRKDL